MINTIRYFESPFMYRTDYRPLYTGYCGIPTTHHCHQSPRIVSNKSRKGSVAAAANPAPNAVKSGLYPKQSRRKKLLQKNGNNKDYLQIKYQNQKKAEANFYHLQSQKAYVEEMIAGNPRLVQFYAAWLSRANQTLKEYTQIIDQPDNLSFSSVYGYSKDEEITAVYRHPILEKQLQQIKRKQTYDQLHNHLNIHQFKRVYI